MTSSAKREIRHFHIVVVQRRQRNVQKAWCTCKVVVLPESKPFAFFPSSLPSLSSLLKLRNGGFTANSVTRAKAVGHSASFPGFSPTRRAGRREPWERGCRPLTSSKNPHFQNEAKWPTFHVKMSFTCMRMKITSISKAEHLTSFWCRGPEGLGNGLFRKLSRPCHISRKLLRGQKSKNLTKMQNVSF